MNRTHAVRLLSLAVACLAHGAALEAATTVTFVNAILQPNLPNQPVTVQVSGGDPILQATVIAELSGAAPLPAFTSGDIVSGTIFESNNTGSPSYEFNDDAIAYLDVGTGSGSVTGGTVGGNALLATVWVDTTDIYSGAFVVNLLGSVAGDTSITRSGEATGPVTYVGGTLTVVPEPASGALIAAGVWVTMAHRRRR